MASFHRIPRHKGDGDERQPFTFIDPLDTELGIAKLQATFSTLQQRLEKLNGDRRKTGSVVHYTAELAQSLETTLLLCQSTYKQLLESHRRLMLFDESDTFRQIEKTLTVLSRVTRVDTLGEQAQTTIINHDT
ncbi:MAG: hypothetical protein OJF51_000686 [Nitrospira sp.]|jgi:hypothetical protein|nr:MAG: hypothetical protein OJF51_000686 [Nitrospira sp.]